MSRTVPLGGTRNVNIRIQANNMLNMANYRSVDTNVNSPTFGQVRSVGGMRSATLNLAFRSDATSCERGDTSSPPHAFGQRALRSL